MSGNWLAVQDHGWVTLNDDRSAMARNRAGHFVANASDRCVVGEGDLRCFNDGAAVAGSIAQHDKWSTQSESLIIWF